MLKVLLEPVFFYLATSNAIVIILFSNVLCETKKKTITIWIFSYDRSIRLQRFGFSFVVQCFYAEMVFPVRFKTVYLVFGFRWFNEPSWYPFSSGGVHLFHQISSNRQSAVVLGLIPVQRASFFMNVTNFERSARWSRLICVSSEKN